jgi:hypothetical protein
MNIKGSAVVWVIVGFVLLLLFLFQPLSQRR